MFSLFGLLALYARLAEKTGRLVLAGFIMTLVGGTTFYLGVLWVGAIIQPVLASNSPRLNDSLVSFSSSPALFPLVIGIILFGVGYSIFSVAAYRSNMMQSWVVWPAVMSIIAVLLTLGAAAVYVFSNVGGVVWGLSLAAWGYAVWSEREPAITRSQPSR